MMQIVRSGVPSMETKFPTHPRAVMSGFDMSARVRTNVPTRYTEGSHPPAGVSATVIPAGESVVRVPRMVIEPLPRKALKSASSPSSVAPCTVINVSTLSCCTPIRFATSLTDASGSMGDRPVLLSLPVAGLTNHAVTRFAPAVPAPAPAVPVAPVGPIGPSGPIGPCGPTGPTALAMPCA